MALDSHKSSICLVRASAVEAQAYHAEAAGSNGHCRQDKLRKINNTHFQFLMPTIKR
jgi:hypothetical protein